MQKIQVVSKSYRGIFLMQMFLFAGYTYVSYKSRINLIRLINITLTERITESYSVIKLDLLGIQKLVASKSENVRAKNNLLIQTRIMKRTGEYPTLEFGILLTYGLSICRTEARQRARQSV